MDPELRISKGVSHLVAIDISLDTADLRLLRSYSAYRLANARRPDLRREEPLPPTAARDLAFPRIVTMAYFQHQFPQVPPAQAAFNNGQFFQEHDPRFQQPQTMGQFPLQGRAWVDPYARGTLLQSHRTETKPRLSKGEVAQLEGVFQENNKPSSNVKKGLAEQMRVDVARINVRTPLLDPRLNKH